MLCGSFSLQELLLVPTKNRAELSHFFFFFFQGQEMLCGSFICRFLMVLGSPGHQFGGIFVTLGVPGPPRAPLGLSLGHFGRPGEKRAAKGRIRHLNTHSIFTCFGTF